MNKPDLPPKIIEQMAEHSSCYIFFWFDAEGLPCMACNFPQVKDKMAMMELINHYMQHGIPPIMDDDDGDDEDQI